MKKLQSDLLGPFEISEFVNKRGTRKVWILSSICHFSRYVSLLPVESLSKIHILDAFRRHFLRYGESKLIETDFGSNFTSAKSDMENPDEALINEDDVKDITESLKLQGIKMSQRSPLSPWIQGGIERANLVIKRVIPWKRMTLFQLLNVLEFAVHTINRRPIGVSSTLETLAPQDIIPVWSKINPQMSFSNCSKIIQKTCQEFQKKWETIYQITMIKQIKWLSTNHTLAIKDIVLILDLKSKSGHPRHGRVKEVTLDSAGQERYFLIEYKITPKKYSTVKRTAHSLIVVYKSTEQREDEQKYIDFLDCVEKRDLGDDNDQENKKLKVKVPVEIQMISDSH
jgi:hypothetical protein